jgi:hypothetical protein
VIAARAKEYSLELIGLCCKYALAFMRQLPELPSADLYVALTFLRRNGRE